MITWVKAKINLDITDVWVLQVVGHFKMWIDLQALLYRFVGVRYTLWAYEYLAVGLTLNYVFYAMADRSAGLVLRICGSWTIFCRFTNMNLNCALRALFMHGVGLLAAGIAGQCKLGGL